MSDIKVGRLVYVKWGAPSVASVSFLWGRLAVVTACRDKTLLVKLVKYKEEPSVDPPSRTLFQEYLVMREEVMSMPEYYQALARFRRAEREE